MTNKETELIEDQSKFIFELVKRLNDDIKNDIRTDEAHCRDYYCWVDAYTVKQADIKRIRRELLKLSKLLEKAW